MNLDISLARFKDLLASRKRTASFAPPTIARPTRDWGIILLCGLAALITVMAGAFFIHESVAEGTLVSVPEGGQSRADVFDSDALTTLLVQMDERARMHEEAIAGSSGLVDPSR